MLYIMSQHIFIFLFIILALKIFRKETGKKSKKSKDDDNNNNNKNEININDEIETAKRLMKNDGIKAIKAAINQCMDEFLNKQGIFSF